MTSKSKPAAEGDVRNVSIEVPGYDAPFTFAITRQAFRQMRQEARKDFDMAGGNFLVRTCTSHNKNVLREMLDTDWSLLDVLSEPILDELGFTRAASLTRPSEPQS